MAGILMVVIIAFFLFKSYLGFIGIEHYFGWFAALAALALALLLRIVFPLSIGSFFGATVVMGWPWWVGVIIVMPSLLLITPALVSAALASASSRWNGIPGQGTSEPIQAPPSQGASNLSGRVRNDASGQPAPASDWSGKAGIVFTLVVSVSLLSIFFYEKVLINRNNDLNRQNSQPSPILSAPMVANVPQIPNFDSYFIRENVFGSWIFQEQRDPSGERSCVIFSGSPNSPSALRTGIGWSNRSGIRFFYDDFHPASGSPQRVVVDGQTFFLNHAATLRISNERLRHTYFFPNELVNPFAAGKILIMHGKNHDLTGSSAAYDALYRCSRA
jgi:hypothetical protein